MTSITDTGDEFRDDPAGEREHYGDNGLPVTNKQDVAAYLAEEEALARAEDEYGCNYWKEHDEYECNYWKEH